MISDILIGFAGLPAGFAYSRDLSVIGKFTEANSANTIFLKNRMRASADLAACISTCRKLGRSLLFDFHGCLSHDTPFTLSCKKSLLYLPE